MGVRLSGVRPMRFGRRVLSFAERFTLQFEPEPNSGRWIWIGARIQTGYGHISRDGRPMEAHRASWSLENGPIPNGLSVLHRCDNPPCVNPRHLFLGSILDNNRDTIQKGRYRLGGLGAIRAMQTHCIHGHPFDQENTFRTPRGNRGCRICRRDDGRRRTARKALARARP